MRKTRRSQAKRSENKILSIRKPNKLNKKKKQFPISRRKLTNTNSNSPFEISDVKKVIENSPPKPNIKTKFLNCPLCNGLIRNFNDLTIHLKEAHAVSEQLINSVLEKFDGKNRKKNDRFNDENQINTLSSYDSKIFDNELNVIKTHLELESIDESKLIEFDFLIGDCYLCNEKYEDNLIIHLNDKHCLNLKDTIEDNYCLICGERLMNQKYFIKHQFNLHNIISFLSLNKLFKLQSLTNCKKENNSNNDVDSGEEDNENIKMNSNNNILKSLKISNKMRERVNLIKNQNRSKKKMAQFSEYEAVKNGLYNNENKDKTKFSLASFAAEYINNKLDPLYDPESLPHQFAVSLMLKLFRSDELVGHSVLKRVDNNNENNNHNHGNNTHSHKEHKEYKGALDEQRVNFIQEIVFKRYNPEDKDCCWLRCVKAMSNKIYSLKLKKYTDNELEEFENERRFIVKLVNTPVNSLEMKSLLEEYMMSVDKNINPNDISSYNYLNKQELRRIFDSSDTIFQFATNLMTKLFSNTELDESANVYGRVFKKDSFIKKPLDAKRIAYIRLQAFKHFSAVNKKACWSKCVKTMNEKIRNLQRRHSDKTINEPTDHSDDNNDDDDDYDDNDYDDDDDDDDTDSESDNDNISCDTLNIDELNDDNDEIDLNKIDLNRIYDETKSPSNFCVKLMFKCFKRSELFNRSVYARVMSNKKNREALDENRVEFIREKLMTFYPTPKDNEKKLWSKCVKAINDKIFYLQKSKRLYKEENIEQDENINQQEQTHEQSLTSSNDTSFKDKITQEDINYLYRSTISPQNFAVRLMLKCFDSNELSRNKNVYGRIYKRDAKQKKALDENRIDFIRETVFRYYPDELKRVCWPKCIKSMNDKIRYINSK